MIEYLLHLIVVAGVFIFFCAVYFVLLEKWRRFGCLHGRHAGYIVSGKFICRTCGKEVKISHGAHE